MAEQPQISIVIVNYNVKDFLLQCLRSIESSSRKITYEVIVVDNNSTDGSINFLSSLFPKIKFIQLTENIGFARANNIGFKEAKGEYILVLNPDTIIQEDTLEIMVKYMEEHPEVGCSGCKVLNSDGSFQLACRRGFPTPWVSFTKLFGLQKIFPNSKVFGRYNQTFMRIDESYYIDSVIGAFMFCRQKAIDEVGGFDEDFFMYGEDIDLCYRLTQRGWKIAYVHSTSIIHFKGESTKRSSINEIKHFYDAMRIFSRKHYSSSRLFLMFLKLGITFRSVFAYLNKYKNYILIIFLDLLIINSALMVSTWFRFGGIFNFPDYAYPTVFIALSIITFFSMVIVGEYFETKPTIRKALFGLLVSFFILSSLTYYFKDFAFSRGVILMTIAITAVLFSIVRGFMLLFEKTKGKDSDRRIAFVGLNDKTASMIEQLRGSELTKVIIVGVISTQADNEKVNDIGFLKDFEFLGSIEILPKIIDNYNINEIVITDTSIAKKDLIKTISIASSSTVRFHIAQEYEELLAARIINEISGVEPTLPKLNINKFRLRTFKRLFDIFVSILLLTIGIPLVFLLKSNKKEYLKSSNIFYDLFKVLKGDYSIVGLYEIQGEKTESGKLGLTGLVHISNPEQLSSAAMKNLNNFYMQEYSFSLDMDIIIKFLFRKKSGNKRNT
ncbi:glycosyltransferase [Bacteroidetes/Chlorobi group bacterium ChocPot_Mid]|nr:MAG: glycosyltransferase [Bacteroidetes/Chlorobi group bacterium ChocPot_Mid]